MPRADLAFSIVSFHEQVLGCNSYIARAKTSIDVVRGYQMFDRVLSAFAAAPVLPFTNNASAIFDGLVVSPLRIATMDLRIASIALSQGLTLLTRNSRDFRSERGEHKPPSAASGERARVAMTDAHLAIGSQPRVVV